MLAIYIIFIDKHLDIKNCSSEKPLIGKLVIKCKDEILNTTETVINYKQEACAKSNCLIHTISLVIICLLLLGVICVSYFYYTKNESKLNIYYHITAPVTN